MEIKNSINAKEYKELERIVGIENISNNIYDRISYAVDPLPFDLKEKNIPVIINSDAHSTDGINCKFEEVYKLIYNLGFEKTYYLSENGWKNQIIKL